MHIVIIGNVCIDTNTTENASYTATGGPAVFMEKIYKNIPDISITIIAPYGEDFLTYAKHLSLLPKTPISQKTLVYENVVRDGVRTQKAYNREEATLIPVENCKEALQQADILIIAPLLPTISSSYIQDVVCSTKKDALKVLLPQGYYRDFLEDNRVVVREFKEEHGILPYMDVVVVSEMDTEEMLTTAEAWAEEYHVLSVVTLGENGAVALDKNTKIYLPTTPVAQDEIVDSVGSGDIFSACFAYAYKKTNSIEKSGAFANAIARACLFYKAEEIHIDKKLLTI